MDSFSYTAAGQPRNPTGFPIRPPAGPGSASYRVRLGLAHKDTPHTLVSWSRWTPAARYYGHAPQGYTRSDERIREEVCDLLMQGHIDPRQLSVSVRDGEVTLEGQVEHRRDKYEVESLAESVLGVKDIENRIRVSSRSATQEDSSGARESSRSQKSGESRDEKSASRRTMS